MDASPQTKSGAPTGRRRAGPATSRRFDPRVRTGRDGLGHDGPMSEIEIPRPTDGDVVERILEDHRLFEDLLRQARRNDTDRAAAREALAEVLVAHATAEEEKVYPELRRSRAITGHEEEHSEEEHAEINEALLAFLAGQGHRHPEVRRHARGAGDGRQPPLERGGADHPQPRPRRGLARAPRGARRAWLDRRNELLEEGCGAEEQVEAKLDEAVDEGVLAPEEAREEADAVEERPRRRRRRSRRRPRRTDGRRTRGASVPWCP